GTGGIYLRSALPRHRDRGSERNVDRACFLTFARHTADPSLPPAASQTNATDSLVPRRERERRGLSPEPPSQRRWTQHRQSPAYHLLANGSLLKNVNNCLATLSRPE